MLTQWQEGDESQRNDLKLAFSSKCAAWVGAWLQERAVLDSLRACAERGGCVCAEYELRAEYCILR